jgi:hypothetical protein
VIRHKSSGQTYDRIFSEISSGKSFVDLSSTAVGVGSENVSFVFQFDSNLTPSAPDQHRFKNLEAPVDVSCTDS